MDAGVIGARLSDARLGEGEFPPELDRLNWSAVMWGLWWPLVHGIWSWFAILLAVLALGVGTALVARGFAPHSIVLAVAAQMFTSITLVSAIVTFAYRANRLVWDKERRRVAAQSDQSVPRPAALALSYLASQKRWALWGMAFFAYTSLYSISTVRGSAIALAVSIVAAAVPTLVYCGLFAYERIRVGREAS